MQANKNIFIGIDGAAYYNNALWCMGAKGNKLYKIDINTGEVEYIYSFSKLEEKPRQIFKILEYNGKLILLPGYSKYIITYDVNSNEEKYYKYQCIDNLESFYRFGTFIIREDSLFLFPGCMKYILKINLENMHLEYLYEPIKYYESIYDKKQNIICSDRGVSKDNKIYVPCYAENAVICLNIDNNLFEIIQIKGGQNEKKGFRDIIVCDNEIFLLDFSGNLLKWDFNLKESIVLMKSAGRIYRCMEKHENIIWLIPGDDKEICFYDLKKGIIQEINYPLEHKFVIYSSKGGITFNDINRNGNEVYITPRCNNMILILNLDKMILKGKKLFLGRRIKNLLKSELNENIRSNKIMNESDYGLEEYIRQIDGQNKIISKSVDIGKQIYNLTIHEDVNDKLK